MDYERPVDNMIECVICDKSATYDPDESGWKCRQGHVTPWSGEGER